jgi:hypothetical protein
MKRKCVKYPGKGSFIIGYCYTVIIESADKHSVRDSNGCKYIFTSKVSKVCFGPV